jgi:metal-sulfur cluster biosynthetic enzyme
MSEEIIEKIKEACRSVNDPHMGVSILEMGILRNIEVDGKVATLTIQPTNPSCMSVTRIAADVKQAAESLDEIDKCNVTVVGHVMADQLTEMFSA